MKKHIMIVLLLVVFVIPFSSGVSLAILTPVADGFYHSYYFCECDYCWGGTDIELGIEVNYDVGGGGGGDMFCEYGYGAGATKIGIMEFNLLSIGAFLTNSQIQEAKLSLTVKGGDLPAEKCLSLYNIQDANENGVIEEVDIDTDDFIGEICEDLQPGDIITFDVTTAIEHDLFDPDQTNFSGFVIDKSTYYQWVDDIE